jgi:drug/metabolite transporter (DMT)-like permease
MSLFAVVDTIAKFLTETLHPLQIVWSWQTGLLLGILVILAFRGVSILRTQHLGLQIARGAMAVGSASIFIYAVSFVPLVDATAVTFVAPFMVTLISVCGGNWPDNNNSCRYCIGWKRDNDSFPAFVWRTPETSIELVLLVSIALIAAVAEVLVIKALDVAGAVFVAPVHYSIIIWATFYGFMVFDQLPDMWTWVGVSIIVVMGMYTLHREWRVKSGWWMPTQWPLSDVERAIIAPVKTAAVGP